MGDNNMGQIDLQEAHATVEKIKKAATNLQNLFDEWKTMRNAALTDDTFRSEAADAYAFKFSRLDGPFDSFVTNVNQKAAELSTATTDYESMEKEETNLVEDINVPH